MLDCGIRAGPRKKVDMQGVVAMDNPKKWLFSKMKILMRLEN